MQPLKYVLIALAMQHERKYVCLYVPNLLSPKAFDVFTAIICLLATASSPKNSKDWNYPQTNVTAVKRTICNSY